MSKELKIDGGFHIHIGNITFNNSGAAPEGIVNAMRDIVSDVDDRLSSIEENGNRKERSTSPSNSSEFEDIEQVLDSKGIHFPPGLKEVLEKVMGAGRPSRRNSLSGAEMVTTILHKAYHHIEDMKDMKVVMGILLCTNVSEEWAKKAVSIPVNPDNPESFKTFGGKLITGLALDFSNNSSEGKYTKLVEDTDPILLKAFLSKEN